MKIETLEKKYNNLLKREEIIFKVENKTCPKKEEIIKEANLDSERVVVKKIDSSFGTNLFKVKVFLYETKEDKQKIEKIPRKIRKKMLEELKKQQENKTA